MKNLKSIIYVLLIPLLMSANCNGQKETTAVIETNMGDITLKLYDDTPQHRDNFIKLAKEGYYDSLLFHRVIDGFMIQAGDPESKGAPKRKRLGSGGPGYTIPAEISANHIHKKGALSAARQGDQVNPEKRSSGSQFYIVQGQVFTNEQLDMFEKQMDVKFTEEQREIYTTLGGTPHLDGAYTVYGEVIEGLDVVDKIAAVKTMPGDRPVEDVIIKTIRIE